MALLYHTFTLFKVTKRSPPFDPNDISLLDEISNFLSIPLNNILYESIESFMFLTSYIHALISLLF